MALLKSHRGHSGASADPKVGEAMRAYRDYICAAETNPHSDIGLFSGDQLNTLLGLKPATLRKFVKATFPNAPVERVQDRVIARIKQFGRTLTGAIRAALPTYPSGHAAPHHRSAQVSKDRHPLF